MNSILTDLNYKDCLEYLDDIILSLRKVLTKLRDANLKLLEKCEFMKKEIEFLGHIVS